MEQKQRLTGGQVQRRSAMFQIQEWIKEDQAVHDGKFDEKQEIDIIRKAMIMLGLTQKKALEYMDLIFGRNLYTHQGEAIPTKEDR
jgi:hypothetical protein